MFKNRRPLQGEAHQQLPDMQLGGHQQMQQQQ
jgi:hypothetical protein